MTRVIDLWRAIDPEARFGSGSMEGLTRPVRAVHRTRAVPPHLPPAAEAHLLIADVGIVTRGLDAFFHALEEAGHVPAAVMMAPIDGPAPDRSSDARPVLYSARMVAELYERATRYLADERAELRRLLLELRLACAEAALADPVPAAPAGLVAARLRRGVAVAINGQLRSLHPRPAGRALAARFSALHARVLAAASSARSGALRRGREGLWLLERTVRPGTSVWIFDDLPLSEVDEIGAEALMVTLRALIARPPARPVAAAARQAAASPAGAPDRFAETVLAVARANGRIAPAARALGVHRNTVRYRLRVVLAERGIDPRRPEDALQILGEAERATG